VRNSSALKPIDADARFSSRCAIEEVPGIGSMAGERCSSQASAIWLGVTPWLWAIRTSGEFGLASLAERKISKKTSWQMALSLYMPRLTDRTKVKGPLFICGVLDHL
jgi:hypothetical protein